MLSGMDYLGGTAYNVTCDSSADTQNRKRPLVDAQPFLKRIRLYVLKASPSRGNKYA